MTDSTKLPLEEELKKKEERQKKRKKRDGKTPPQPAGKRSNVSLQTSSPSWAVPQAAAAPSSPFSPSPDSLPGPAEPPYRVLSAACCDRALIARGC